MSEEEEGSAESCCQTQAADDRTDSGCDSSSISSSGSAGRAQQKGSRSLSKSHRNPSPGRQGTPGSASSTTTGRRSASPSKSARQRTRRPSKGPGPSPSASAKEAPEEAHAILGVDSWASAAEIRKAFKRAALATHPDKAKDADSGSDEAERFLAVQAAYESLLERSNARNKERVAARRQACEKVYAQWETQRQRAQQQAAQSARVPVGQPKAGPARYFSIPTQLIYHMDAGCQKLACMQQGASAARLVTDSIRPVGLEACQLCCVTRAKTSRDTARTPTLRPPTPTYLALPVPR